MHFTSLLTMVAVSVSFAAAAAVAQHASEVGSVLLAARGCPGQSCGACESKVTTTGECDEWICCGCALC